MALKRGQTWPVLKQWSLLNKTFSYYTMFYSSWSSHHTLPRHMSNPVWSHKIEKPTNIGEIDEVHLKCEFFEGSSVKGVRERLLFGIALDKPSGHKRYKEPIIKLFEKNYVLSGITFFLENIDRKTG